MTTLEIILLAVIAYLVICIILFLVFYERAGFRETMLFTLIILFALPITIGGFLWYLIIEQIRAKVINRRWDKQHEEKK